MTWLRRLGWLGLWNELVLLLLGEWIKFWWSLTIKLVRTFLRATHLHSHELLLLLDLLWSRVHVRVRRLLHKLLLLGIHGLLRHLLLPHHWVLGPHLLVSHLVEHLIGRGLSSIHSRGGIHSQHLLSLRRQRGRSLSHLHWRDRRLLLLLEGHRLWRCLIYLSRNLLLFFCRNGFMSIDQPCRTINMLPLLWLLIES